MNESRKFYKTIWFWILAVIITILILFVSAASYAYISYKEHIENTSSSVDSSIVYEIDK